MSDKERPLPKISLFDIFIGSGRTIRNPTGYPGTTLPARASPRKSSANSKVPSLVDTPLNGDVLPKPAVIDEDVPKGGSDKVEAHEGDASKSNDNTPKQEDTKQEEDMEDEKKEDREDDKKDDKTDEKKDEKKDGVGEDDAKKPDITAVAKDVVATTNTAAFTPEQDTLILSMKADNKSWKEIAQELGKAPSHVKKHFVEMKKADPTSGGQADDGKASTKADKDDAAKHSNHEKYAEGDEKKKKKKKKKNEEQLERQKKERGEQKQKKDHDEQRKRSERLQPPPSVVSKVSSWLELQEDDLFSYGELQELVDILDEDVKKTWDRVASAFYDKTGRRILPSDIRDKLQTSSGATAW